MESKTPATTTDGFATRFPSGSPDSFAEAGAGSRSERTKSKPAVYLRSPGRAALEKGTPPRMPALLRARVLKASCTAPS